MIPEITMNDEFGKTIYKVVTKYIPKYILEIGSGDGSGSTSCFLQAISNANVHIERFVCLEAYKPNHEELQNIISNYPNVHSSCIPSISYTSLLAKDFETDVWNSPYNKNTQYDYSLVKGWYERDVKQMQEIQHGFLDTDKTERWDVVLIDGGEFTGYSEYTLLKDKTNVFLLDDVHHSYKCNQIYCELKNDDKWELLFNLPHVRNGAAGFKRKDV